MNEKHSTTTAKAGQRALILTVFSCLWISGILLIQKPFTAGTPNLVQSLFWLIGLATALGAISLWRERLRGGSATLHLPQDPLPLGIPSKIGVEFERDPAEGEWRAEVYVRSQRPRDEDPVLEWTTTIVISSLIGRRATFTLQLPADVPSTVGRAKEISIGCELVIFGPHGQWSFDLATRAANERELAEHPPLRKAPPAPADPKQLRHRRRVFIGFGVCALLVMAVMLRGAFFGININLGPSYDVPDQFPEFAMRISSWRDNSWGVQAQLEGQAHIAERTLELKEAKLRLRGFLRCGNQDQCQIESASLLLAKDEVTSFVTLAESTSVPLNVRLHDHRVAEVAPLDFRLSLPDGIAREGVYLKLALRSVGQGTIYIDSPHLQLQRMLAAREGMVDPCTYVKRMDEAVRSGCPAENAPSLVNGKSAGIADTLDQTLILALRHEANDWIPALITAGANPDARDPDNTQLTALALAAESDDIDLMNLLIERGADASIETTNDHGQTVTPLNRALRGDSVRAVARLLSAGARLQPPDATGWSTMQVAAYEGAVASLPALVHAGGDVNERSTEPRHQTPLMTAIQHSTIATVRQLIELGADPRLQDANGQDSCEWAKQFKRESDLRALVCTTKIT